MTDDVLFEIRGRLALITLNRPKALNALNRDMANAIRTQLEVWETDDDVEAVAIQGEGDRAFCAGGDVITVYHAGKAGSDDWEGFFTDEYRMNHKIGTYPKPYIAFLDGITMGGGVGLSIHAPYRVATENILFAMPETGIGLIPDVGGTHALAKLPGELGTYLGLTGARLKAADAYYAGIATHYTLSGNLPDLIAQLAADRDPIAEVMARYEAPPPGEAELAAHRDAIDKHFAEETVEGIMASLSMGGEWAQAQRDTLMKMSPTSMKLTLRGLREAKGSTLADALTREYRLVANIKQGEDFYEGIRAQLIDKDRKPRWQPAALRDVTEEMVDGYFASPAGGDLQL